MLDVLTIISIFISGMLLVVICSYGKSDTKKGILLETLFWLYTTITSTVTYVTIMQRESVAVQKEWFYFCLLSYIMLLAEIIDIWEKFFKK